MTESRDAKLTPQDIYNRDYHRLTGEFITPMLNAGGNFLDVLVLLESVVAGVLMTGTPEERIDEAARSFAIGVRQRMIEIAASFEKSVH